ncbi:hypothetical protein CC78DRAFT_619404 [Lojkania enalia]|uniref:Heterokaryon incompatibility domain-containing protein n=1 Tax=Lojkania enalia TaxID=147567 RepID=A0A9P4N0J8_9PLEO|nr:hypothetical protein CC78DRAFT_619404 [Didymosphaeria enalia]
MHKLKKRAAQYRARLWPSSDHVISPHRELLEASPAASPDTKTSIPETDTCRQNFTIYTYEQLPGEKWIRLLRIIGRPTQDDTLLTLSMHPFRLESAPKFNALSYTWGNPMVPFSSLYVEDNEDSVRKYSVEVDGRKLLVTKNLLDALYEIRRMEAKGEFLWVDGICINQDDIIERGFQVAIMGEIFKTCTNVIVWFGPTDEFFHNAFKFMDAISKIPPQSYQNISHPPWRSRAKVLLDLGAETTPHYTHWIAFAAFLCRPWFSRTWVVQEMALPLNVTLLCGSLTFPWSHLAHTLDFLRRTDWYKHISTLQDIADTFHQELLAGKEMFHRMLENASDDDIYSRALWLYWVRTDIHSGRPVDYFEELIILNRHRKSSNPRDQIFAMLGLAHNDQSRLIKPNYSIEVSNLFTFVTTLALHYHRHESNLRFLEQVEMKLIEGGLDLPSWVPDYRRPVRPKSIYNNAFNACGIFNWSGNVDMTDANFLNVTGVPVSSIKTLEAPRIGHRSPANGCTIIELILQAAAVQFPSDSRITTFELLWRTLITDRRHFEHPAPSRCGAWVFEILAFLGSESIYARASDIGVILSLRDRLFNSTSSWQAQMEGLLQDQESSHYTFWNLQTRAYDIGIEIKRDHYDYKAISSLAPSIKICLWNRLYFLSNDGRVGLGWKSIEIGDEIWILGGSKVPVILRSLGNGVYRFVGQAYVYGIMDGEAVEGLEEMKEIRLR